MSNEIIAGLVTALLAGFMVGWVWRGWRQVVAENAEREEASRQRRFDSLRDDIRELRETLHSHILAHGGKQ